MSGQTMCGMISLQTEPPSAADIATDIVSGLDTDSDGEVSAEEISAAFSAAGIDTAGVESALATVDADASGSLNADELASAISSAMQASGAKGPPPGGPPPGGPPPGADEAASSILSAFDTDEDSGLSMDEVLTALGMESDEETDSVSSVFSSLDSDDDGQISLAELSGAIEQSMSAGYRAYAEQALQSA